MATLSISRVGLRVSINLDCESDDEADSIEYNLVSNYLDNAKIGLEPATGREAPERHYKTAPGE